MKKDLILITGGLGFIGSALTYHFNKKGIYNIVLADHFREQDKWKNVRGLLFSDIIASEAVFNFLEKHLVKTIYHLGACSDTREEDMNFLFKNNFEFSKKLCEIALEKGINFIYASSAATYGSEEKNFLESQDIKKLLPINKYGYSKQLFDIWLLERLPVWQEKMKSQSGLILAGIKFFNVFGPQEYHKGSMVSVVYHGFNQIKKTGKMKLFKSYREDIAHGEQKRDFVYIKDVTTFLVEMELDLSENLRKRILEKNNFIFNLGSGQANSFKELVNTLFKSLDLEPQIEYIDMDESLKPRYQYYTKAAMDWNKPKNSSYLEGAIFDYVREYLEKANPYFSHFAEEKYLKN